MNKYLEYLAKQAGLHTSTSGDDGDGGWESLEAEKDGRPLPTLAVWWDSHNKEWVAMVGVEDDTSHLERSFAHPSDAFQWLRNAVAAYVWPVCPKCDDTGIERWAVGDVDHSDWCECFHGERAKDAKEMADEMRADWEVQEAMDRR